MHACRSTLEDPTYLNGGAQLPEPGRPACQRFPLIALPAGPLEVAAGASVAFVARGGADDRHPADPGYAWSLEAAPSGGRIEIVTGAYTAGNIGGVDDVVRLTDADGATVQVTVHVTGGSRPCGCSASAEALAALALAWALGTRRRALRRAPPR